MKYGVVSKCAAICICLALAGCGQAPGGSDGSDSSSASNLAGVPPAVHPGKKTYERFCFSCHATGAASAPKLGDKAAWQPRIALGIDVLVQASMDGIPPGMPAKGMCMTCSEAEIRNAVEYMVQSSQ